MIAKSSCWLATVRPSGALGEPTDHLGGVRGVGDEEDPVVAVEVGDQIVHDAACRVVAAQGVLRLPGKILPRSLVSVRFTYAAAPGPASRLAEVTDVEDADRSRTAACSLRTPAGYSSGISQPPNSENLAPNATCRSWSGDFFMSANLQQSSRPSHGLECQSTRELRASARRTSQPTSKEHRWQHPTARPDITLRKGSAEKTATDVVVVGAVRTADGPRPVGPGKVSPTRSVAASSHCSRRSVSLARPGDVARIPRSGTLSPLCSSLSGSGGRDPRLPTKGRRHRRTRPEQHRSVALAFPTEDPADPSRHGGLPARAATPSPATRAVNRRSLQRARGSQRRGAPPGRPRRSRLRSDGRCRRAYPRLGEHPSRRPPPGRLRRRDGPAQQGAHRRA